MGQELYSSTTIKSNSQNKFIAVSECLCLSVIGRRSYQPPHTHTHTAVVRPVIQLEILSEIDCDNVTQQISDLLPAFLTYRPGLVVLGLAYIQPVFRVRKQ